MRSQPGGERHEMITTTPFGKTAMLPEPVGFELETESLKTGCVSSVGGPRIRSPRWTVLCCHTGYVLPARKPRA